MKKETTMPNFIELEHNVLNFWQQNQVFEKMVQKNQDKPVYRSLDGPITANNPMGIHHVWGRTLKDLYIKFKAMTGYAPKYQNGFDAHGLPVEVEVEKELGTKTKKDILDYGMDNFVQKCLDRVDNYSGIITEQSIRFGQLMDWENSYYTNSDQNITSIWQFLKKVSENGWLAKASKPMPWCPRCGTSLSTHELHGSYKDLEHTAVFFKAPIKNENRVMLVWTTTPWTLTSNVAIAVNPNNDYAEVKVKSDSRNIVVGVEAVKVLKDDKVEIVRTFKGSELVGKEYETCFNKLEVQDFVHTIVAWDEVSATDGSGAVHIAPGCGEEDFELGKKLGLKEITPIDDNGVIIKGFGKFSGVKTKDVASLVFDELKNDNKLYYTHKFTHSYPICWRCKEEIVFRLVESWFIKVDELRPQLVNAIEDVVFEPEYMKKRMLDWLNNMGDWNISRSRYYGVPLPVYITEKGEIIVIGSKEELRELAVDKELVDSLPHLHRPFIDKVVIKSPKTGDLAYRVPEVGDTWLDAGITPFSTNEFFTNKQEWEKHFPAEVVIEMYEQIRLWFYSLLVMSVVLVGKAPYQKVIGHESIVQEDGSKFSKSGFSIKANDFAEKLGADPARFMMASNPLTSSIRFGFNLGEDARRRLLGFWNSYTFFNTYAVLDNPKLDGYTPKESELDVTDKWLVQITNEFIKNSYNNYNEHKSFLVVKDFEKLIDDLTNFYIRANRRRFWKSENATDKLTAYWSLYSTLKAVTLVMAPIIPFMTEHIWQGMVREVEANAPISVYLQDFPTSIYNADYKEYVASADLAKTVITLGARLRNENQLKVKQPLSKMYVVTTDTDAHSAMEMFENVIKDELNIKEIVVTSDELAFNDYYLTVNFKAAGAVLKGEVQKLKNTLESFSANEVLELVNGYDNGKVNVVGFGELDASLFVKNSKPKQEFVLTKESGVLVVLDTTLTPDLVKEGYAREIIRHAQVLRKEADFNIEARVLLNITSNESIINEVVKENEDKIKEEVLAEKLNQGTFDADIEREVSVSDYLVTISLKAIK